jgi:hypothetical protein
MFDRRKLIPLGVAALMFVPFTVSTSEGLGTQTACAQESGQGCCFNVLAICDVGGEPQHQYENKSWIQIIFGCGGGDGIE